MHTHSLPLLLRATVIPQRWPACRADAGSFRRDPDVRQYLADITAARNGDTASRVSAKVSDAASQEHSRLVRKAASAGVYAGCLKKPFAEGFDFFALPLAGPARDKMRLLGQR